MKIPHIITLGALASTALVHAQEAAPTYTANPVYNAPTLSQNGNQATATGTWSPVGLDPMDFTAIVSLAYNSESSYSLVTTQITGTGTGVGSHDSYIYNIVSPNATAGDIITLNIDYTDIGATGPESGVTWDEDPAFKVNRSINDQTTDFIATLNNYDVDQAHSVFNTFSAQFTVSGSNPNLGEGGDSDGAQSIPSFSSDGVIFTSAKAGPIAWNATGSPAESVPEPSSTLLLGLGSLCLLRRKR